MNELIMDTGAYTYEDLADWIIGKGMSLFLNIVNFLY